MSFKEWWQRDIDAMVLRDRNHPSVVMWSIGNEIPERGNPRGAELAKMQADYVRTLDPTRPVTSALNGVNPWTNTDGFFAALDIGGYNYNLNNHVADHKRVPSRIIACTESFLSQAFDYWQMVADTPYIVGDFVWTAIDYLGESGIGRWDIRDVGDTSRDARDGKRSKLSLARLRLRRPGHLRIPEGQFALPEHRMGPGRETLPRRAVARARRQATQCNPMGGVAGLSQLDVAGLGGKAAPKWRSTPGTMRCASSWTTS